MFFWVVWSGPELINLFEYAETRRNNIEIHYTCCAKGIDVHYLLKRSRRKHGLYYVSTQCIPQLSCTNNPLISFPLSFKSGVIILAFMPYNKFVWGRLLFSLSLPSLMQHSNIVMEHCVKKDKEPALGLYDNGTKAWPKDTQDTDSD